MKAARDVTDFQYEGIGRQEHTVPYNAISEAIKRRVRGFGMSGMSLLYVGRQVSGSMKCAPGERCRQQLIPRDGDGDGHGLGVCYNTVDPLPHKDYLNNTVDPLPHKSSNSHTGGTSDRLVNMHC